MAEVIKIEDKEYPKRLKELGKDAAQKLHYKGEWTQDIFKNCLAVVGTRRMTSYGRRITEQIVGEAASAGVTIVSGFMYGIDAIAHKSALNVGGKTIAVMPCGAEVIHPAFQKDLYNEILNNKGLIISEFEDNFPPALWTYPRRNRIVAGLSQAVLVVEAPLKSGALITAKCAKKYSRKIFSVPGPITSKTSEGNLLLLQEGAGLVTSAKDILDFYHLDTAFKKTAPLRQGLFNEIEQQIIEQLKSEPLEADILARNLGLPVSKIGTTLSLMQLKGFINQEGNKYYVD
jgi:DNA processing protein